MKTFYAIIILALGCTQAYAHDIDEELAAFERVYATKNPKGDEARAARLLVEQARAYIRYTDQDQLLRIRALTNSGLKAVGEQPATLAHELDRLEAAVAKPKTADPVNIAEAKRLLEQAKSDKAAYDALEKAVFENFKDAMKLLEKSK